MRVSQDMTERGEPIIAKNVQESCFSRWVCVYPAYLNSRKTVQQGRRISKSRAIENPTCPEIKDVCLSQKSATRHMIVELTPTHTPTHSMNVELEPKNYPREQQRDQIHFGRVRVQLVNEEGSFCNETIRTSRSLTI